MNYQFETIDSQSFKLNINISDNFSEIVMQLKTPFQSTKTLVHAHEILTENLPEVLSSRCSNKENLPFREKVKNTNLAHLFEHILLQHLANAKGKNKDNLSYKGMTNWDWREGKDPVGVYRITIHIQKVESQVLKSAIDESTVLFEKIINAG